MDKKGSAIRAYRWQTIKEHSILWSLFVLSIIFSIACPILINSFFPAEISPKINAILSGMANISYGYLSGFLVYLFGTFLSSTKKDVELKDNIYFQLTLIFDSLLAAEKRFLSYNSEIDTKKYQMILYNYLVSGFTITTEFLDIDSQPDFPLVDEDHYSSLLYNLGDICTSTGEFLDSYKKDLDIQDLEVINKLHHMKESLEETIEKSLPLSEINVRRYDNKWLTYFVSDFYFYFRTQFVYICKKYEKYKYCDYDINYN